MATLNNIFNEKYSSKENVYYPDADIIQRRRRCGISQWSRAWVEFTEATTLHGIRHIWERNTYKLRRFIWLVLVLAGVGLMSYQIVDRIIYYRSWPSNVNVRVNFNDTLTYPAITICNQNSFKATSSAALGRYRLIEAMYSQSGNFSWDDIGTEYNASEIRMDDLMLSAAHSKEDLIVSCTWGKAPCYLGNFTQVVTDHGVCYTFNNPEEKESLLEVTNAGIDYGLRLVLNVEQYEYMPGPHGAAGVRIYIHDQDEYPLVEELGLAIPTGSHTFVGNSLFVLNNLFPPHGECGTKDMPYFPGNNTYTTARCKIDCRTDQLEKACGCRESHLPHIEDFPPVCTLGQVFNCVQPFMAHFHTVENEICQCPVPCHFQSYEPSISYATTSGFVIDRLLANLNSDELQKKYINAREVTHRLEHAKFEGFKKKANTVKVRLSAIESLLKEGIQRKLEEQLGTLHFKGVEIRKIWQRKHFINEYQKYAIQKNFVRARDAMEERTLSHIGDGYQEDVLEIRANLELLTDPSIDDPTIRETIYLLTKDKLSVEIEMISRGIFNLTELIDAYKSGEGIFNYKFRNLPRKNNRYIIPKKLLNESFDRNWASRFYSLRYKPDMEKLIEKAMTYLNLTEIAFYNGTLDKNALRSLEKSTEKYYRRFFGDKANIYFESVEWPVEMLSLKIENFTKVWQEFTTISTRIHTNVEIISQSMEKVEKDVMPNLRHLSEISQEYIANSDIRKLDVAKVVLSPNIHEGINTMKVFFHEVRSRGQAMFDDWLKLANSAERIWRLILEDENSIDYYQFMGYADFLRNVSTVLAQEYEDFTLIRDETDIRDLIGNNDRAFYSSLYDMMSLAGGYKKGTKLDESFLKDNFVFLDVFYNQLSYEQVNQQEDYSIFSLLCDIGGSMGLFLGASAMSLFELVDLFVDHSFKQIIGLKR